MKRLRLLVVASLGAALAACGPSDSGTTSDAGPGDAGEDSPPDGGTDPPDLGSGTWEFENVSQTPDTMGFYAQLAFLSGGARHATWAETAPSGGSDMDVYVAARSAGAWSNTPLTNDDQQNTFTSLATDGEQIYLVWSGRAGSESDYDIYLSLYTDGAWQEAQDLTSGFEDDAARRDTRARASLGSDGRLSIAYLSRPLTPTGDLDGPAEVRLLKVRGNDVFAPVTVIPSEEATCSEVVVASAPSGTTHVVATCGSLYHAHDEGGPWTSSPLGLRGDTQYSPEIAANDEHLHLVYRGGIPCGDSSCGEIFYTRRSERGEFGRSINVSGSADVTDILPAIAVDPWGRILVAYQEVENRDALFSYSETGASFTAPVNLAPGTPDTDEQPTHIALDPESGLPSVVLLRLFSGTDPLNIDIFVADLLPTAR